MQEPKSKDAIMSLYKSNLEDIALLFFVEAQRQIVPSISVIQSIKNFVKHCDIIEADYDLNKANVIYYRMKKKYFDACKTDTGHNR